MPFERDESLTGRNGMIWRRWRVYGWTQQRIADEYSLSQGHVSAIIEQVDKEIGALAYGDLIKDSFETLRELKSRYMEMADMNGAPVTAGKDGIVVEDPETGETVRDFSLRTSALAGAAKIDDMMAKRFGLNAPEKIQTEATVRYEVVGVETGDLV